MQKEGRLSGFFGGFLIGLVVFSAVSLWWLPDFQNLPQTETETPPSPPENEAILLVLTDDTTVLGMAAVVADYGAGRIAVTAIPPSCAVFRGMEQVRLSALYPDSACSARTLAAATASWGLPITRFVRLSLSGVVAFLSPLGNDLPLSVEEEIRVSAADGVLTLPVGESILSASQVGLLLRYAPDRLAAVAAATVNAYADRSPSAMLSRLLSVAEETDLTAADPLYAEERLWAVWPPKRRGPAVATELSGEWVGPETDRWFYPKENS